MSILITYLSLYNYKEERSYHATDLGADEIIKASQTNEPVLCLLKKLMDKTGGKIEKVITIVSYKTLNEKCRAEPDKTTYEYFSELTKNFVGRTDVLCPIKEYEDENTLRETGAIIGDICDQLNADDEIYIDTSGGPRTAANTLQLLTKILKYKGYTIAASYYSNINGSEAQIQKTNDFTDLTDLADEVNEFVHTGKSYQLSECFKDENNSEIKALIKCMNDFTDRMQLCDISKLDKTLKDMRRHIENVRRIDSDDTKIVLLVNLLSVIENKFFTEGSDGIDYCSMIKWCLENGLIQQAVTIYIEKMPKYIFDKKILICEKEYHDKIMEENKTNHGKQNTDAVIFYEKFMEVKHAERTEAAEKLLNTINKKLSSKGTDGSYHFNNDPNPIIAALSRIGNNTKNRSRQEFRTMVSQKFQNPHFNESDEIREMKKRVADICTNNIGSFEALINVLCPNTNNHKDPKAVKMAMKLIYGYVPSFNTLDKKIDTALNIAKEDLVCGGVEINPKTDKELLSKILFDYIYAKSVRNTINHASDQENLNDKQKRIFKENGYENVGDFTIKTIREILSRSVDRIEKNALAVSK